MRCERLGFGGREKVSCGNGVVAQEEGGGVVVVVHARGPYGQDVDPVSCLQRRASKKQGKAKTRRDGARSRPKSYLLPRSGRANNRLSRGRGA